jgi:hypothetical protein
MPAFGWNWAGTESFMEKGPARRLADRESLADANISTE